MVCIWSESAPGQLQLTHGAKGNPRAHDTQPKGKQIQILFALPATISFASTLRENAHY